MTSLDEILLGCQKHERKSQQKLYETYAGRMLAICMRYTKSREDAEDVLQEGFLKIFNSIGQYRNEGSFEGWMKRIFVGMAIDHFRKHKKLDLNDDIQGLIIPEQNTILADISAKELIQLISKLPDGYQIVFNLYAIEGFTHKEIAEKLEISEGTSKSQFARARAKLLEILNAKNIHAYD